MLAFCGNVQLYGLTGILIILPKKKYFDSRVTNSQGLLFRWCAKRLFSLFLPPGQKPMHIFYCGEQAKSLERTHAGMRCSGFNWLFSNLVLLPRQRCFCLFSEKALPVVSAGCFRRQKNRNTNIASGEASKKLATKEEDSKLFSSSTFQYQQGFKASRRNILLRSPTERSFPSLRHYKSLAFPNFHNRTMHFSFAALLTLWSPQVNAIPLLGGRFETTTDVQNLLNLGLDAADMREATDLATKALIYKEVSVSFWGLSLHIYGL